MAFCYMVQPLKHFFLLCLYYKKKAIRSVCSANYNAHSLPLLKSVGSLTLFDLHKFHLLKLIHRFINNKLPALFSQVFIPSSRTRPPSLRLGPQAPILPYRSQKLLDSYLYTGPMLFNALSRDLRSAPLHKFLTIIKKDFFQNYI